ncbi:putative diacylglycerol kinase [Toxoplasma gondii p89]|uniref:Diacylglycerol kinase n=4 Tax=Toxoplasma gondii TaxID=5811 RepID=A0A2T6INX9_TOXGO|nr:putative diacylglycerol kinase [Toxoplasma gondii p89]PUA87047.1 putative diacylglycerol kinase [Toxoplasma gondii TgCATBr9]
MAQLASRSLCAGPSSACHGSRRFLLASLAVLFFVGLGCCLGVPVSPSPPADASEDLFCTYYGDSDCPSFLSFAAQTLGLCFRTWKNVSAAALEAGLSGLARLVPFLATDGATSRMIHIVLSVLATVCFLLLLSQIFWRYRVHHYNKSGSQGLIPKSLHQWEPFSSSSSPRYCSVCRQLISGFLIYRNTGWACTLCQRYAHTKCLRLAERLDCKTPCLPAPTPHVFIQGNLSAEATCCCCGLACSSNFGLDGLRCLWCNRTLHEECRHRLPSPLCDLGPFRQLVLPPSAVSLSFSLLSSNRGLLRVASSLWRRVGVKEVVKEGLREVQEGVRKFNEAIVQPLKKSLKFEQRHSEQVVQGERGKTRLEGAHEKQREGKGDAHQLASEVEENRSTEQASGEAECRGNSGGSREAESGEDPLANEATRESKSVENESVDKEKEKDAQKKPREETCELVGEEEQEDATRGDGSDNPPVDPGGKKDGGRSEPPRILSRFSESKGQPKPTTTARDSSTDSAAPSLTAASSDTQRLPEAEQTQDARSQRTDASPWGENKSTGGGQAGEAVEQHGDSAAIERGTGDREAAETSQPHGWAPDSSGETLHTPARDDPPCPHNARRKLASTQRDEKQREGTACLLASAASSFACHGPPEPLGSHRPTAGAATSEEGDESRCQKTESENDGLGSGDVVRVGGFTDFTEERSEEDLRTPSLEKGSEGQDARQTEPDGRQKSGAPSEEALEKEDASVVSGKKLRLKTPRRNGSSLPGAGSKTRRRESSRTQMMYTVAKAMPPMAAVWRLRSNPSLWFSEPQATPLLVFVNVKSGGQTGKAIYKDLVAILNPLQVIDIQAEGGPSRALSFFRPLAMTKRLRVLVCGGDGTVGWIIDSIHKVYGAEAAEEERGSEAQTGDEVDSGEAAGKVGVESEGRRGRRESEGVAWGSRDRACDLRSLVPVGICPLGTGNDLSNVLGWGFSFDGDIMKHLLKIQSAVSSTLDLWKVKVISDKTNATLVETTFSNYLDVGVAARIVLKFHKLREENPELFQSRLGNKFLYGEVGFRDFLVTPNIALRGLKIFCDGQEIALPYLEGICVVNIPSFAGGVELWDTAPESWAASASPGGLSPLPSLRYSSHDVGRAPQQRQLLPSFPVSHNRESRSHAVSHLSQSAHALPATRRRMHTRLSRAREDRKAVEKVHLSDPPSFSPASSAAVFHLAPPRTSVSGRSVSATHHRSRRACEAAAEEFRACRCCCCGAQVTLPSFPRGDSVSTGARSSSSRFSACTDSAPPVSASLRDFRLRERLAGTRTQSPHPRMSSSLSGEYCDALHTNFSRRKRARHERMHFSIPSLNSSSLPTSFVHATSVRASSSALSSPPWEPAVELRGASPTDAGSRRRCVSEESREKRRLERTPVPDAGDRHEGDRGNLPSGSKASRSTADPEIAPAVAPQELSPKDSDGCTRDRQKKSQSKAAEEDDDSVDRPFAGSSQRKSRVSCSTSPLKNRKTKDSHNRKRSARGAGRGVWHTRGQSLEDVSVSELSPRRARRGRNVEERLRKGRVACSAWLRFPENRTKLCCGDCCGCSNARDATYSPSIRPRRDEGEEREEGERTRFASSRKSASCGPRGSESEESNRGERETVEASGREGREMRRSQRAETLAVDRGPEEPKLEIACKPNVAGPQRLAGSEKNAESEEMKEQAQREEGTKSEIKSPNGPTRWRQQIINDQLIEVVGFKSLFHLGQVQVGLAKPVRLCQGRDIQLVLPQEIPLQIDGEPTMLQAETTMHITWHGETPVLLASDKSAQTQTLAAVQQVLATAYSRGLLSDYQFAQLANEFQKRF